MKPFSPFLEQKKLANVPVILTSKDWTWFRLHVSSEGSFWPVSIKGNTRDKKKVGSKSIMTQVYHVLVIN